MRLAYWTGMRRWDCSTNTTAAITRMPTAITMTKMFGPCATAMAHSAEGNVAAMETKIRSDMPLPMPRSVTSSPSHMIRPVPAVIVMTMSRMAYQASLVMSWLHCGTPDVVGNSAPARATVMSVVDCRMASAIVR